VRTLHPRSEDLATGDADGMLWLDDPDRCCALRKVVPLASALNSFDAWVSGRMVVTVVPITSASVASIEVFTKTGKNP
jgi:phosphoadenosine phosphosulfate reductase